MVVGYDNILALRHLERFNAANISGQRSVVAVEALGNLLQMRTGLCRNWALYKWSFIEMGLYTNGLCRNKVL
jgi:hypothetical protein